MRSLLHCLLEIKASDQDLRSDICMPCTYSMSLFSRKVVRGTIFQNKRETFYFAALDNRSYIHVWNFGDKFRIMNRPFGCNGKYLHSPCSQARLPSNPKSSFLQGAPYNTLIQAYQSDIPLNEIPPKLGDKNFAIFVT